VTRDDVRDLLIDYLDGALPAETAAHVSSRLAEDALLREELEALREAEAAVKALPKVKAPQDFLAKLNIAIDAGAAVATTPKATPVTTTATTAKAAPSNGSVAHGPGGAAPKSEGARVLRWHAPPRALAMAAMLLLGIGIGTVYQSLIMTAGSVHPERASAPRADRFGAASEAASIVASAPAGAAALEAPALETSTVDAAAMDTATFGVASREAAPTFAKGGVGRVTGGRSLPDARGHSSAEFDTGALDLQKLEAGGASLKAAPPGTYASRPAPPPALAAAPPAIPATAPAPAPVVITGAAPEPPFSADDSLVAKRVERAGAAGDRGRYADAAEKRKDAPPGAPEEPSAGVPSQTMQGGASPPAEAAQGLAGAPKEDAANRQSAPAVVADAAVTAAQAAAFAEAEEQRFREEELLEALAHAEASHRRRAEEVAALQADEERRLAAAREREAATLADGTPGGIEANKSLPDRASGDGAIAAKGAPQGGEPGAGGGSSALAGVTLAGAPRDALRDGAAGLLGAPQATVLVRLSGVEESVARERLAEVMVANDVRNYAWVGGEEMAPSSERGVVVVEADALQSHHVLDDVAGLGRVELTRDDGAAVSAVTRALENRRSLRGLQAGLAQGQARAPAGGGTGAGAASGEEAETRRAEASSYEEGRQEHAKAAAEKAVEVEVERQRALIEAKRQAATVTQTAGKAADLDQAPAAPPAPEQRPQARQRALGANRGANQARNAQQGESDPAQRVILLIEVRPDAAVSTESRAAGAKAAETNAAEPTPAPPAEQQKK